MEEPIKLETENVFEPEKPPKAERKNRTIADATKQFDVNLLAQAMQFIHLVVVCNQMIMLAAIIHAEAKEDGSLLLSMSNGIDLTLTPEDAVTLTQVLNRGVEMAKSQAARQAGQQLGLIQVPGMTH